MADDVRGRTGVVCGSSSVYLRRVIGRDALTDCCPASIIGALPGGRLPVCLAGWIRAPHRREMPVGHGCAQGAARGVAVGPCRQKRHSRNQQFAQRNALRVADHFREWYIHRISLLSRLYHIPTNLQARYDLFCVKSAVKPQPTNQPTI